MPSKDKGKIKGKVRQEKDSLGEKSIPATVYYGIQTHRAVENFPLSDFRFPIEVIYAVAAVKIAAARANSELGAISKKRGNAIIKAAKEITEGKLDDEFVIDAYQAGAGTSSHMNVNEVIANRANVILGGKKGKYSPIHPNDHVNYGQSTNDVMPTAMRISSHLLADGLIKETALLAKSFRKKEKEFAKVIKSARTHLQDAVPMTLGNEFGAYAANAERWKRNISDTLPSLKEVGIGGTASGSGINTVKGYLRLVIKYLSKETGLRLKASKNLFEAMQSMAPLLELSGVLRNFSVDLTRICNDLRLLSSGPSTGLKEINLPELQPGSSIMPGKVNPVAAEALNMVCFQVIGNDTAIAFAGQAGQLELNVMMPLIAFNITTSLKILRNSIKMLREKCVEGVTANPEICRRFAERSAGVATALNTRIGYGRASEIVKRAQREKRPVAEIIREEKVLSEKEVEEIFLKDK